MNKVFKYIVIDILRNKTVLFYTLFLMVICIFNRLRNSHSDLWANSNRHDHDPNRMFIVRYFCCHFNAGYSFYTRQSKRDRKSNFVMAVFCIDLRWTCSIPFVSIFLISFRKDFFGTTFGFIISLFVLALWVIIPLIISTKKFQTKDL